nr:immunoglobulin heavy chain junction region [Macaca mulatta]MOY24833.1 immunoglobulin heavy chain junction region [Macaca mulatta]MOY25309.1 immunoglobulin heavy chain junction region [Macaca mulatta]MOY27000.1 immunoglobulin heavy chain junction region [Macaca mulatta]MOY28152.1 immunoglobulin heavy chain junction region [Macaca mulatta]
CARQTFPTVTKDYW